ncbi:hypothetical protein [Bradyrhizobium sp. NAS96.2]|uniref:hypothetical protein n=1 Tax=Bradyrhizobium sp. NAS96.2 TaxID=1680160 RepID=UPI0011612427|nr:hypothetical protein [Bradyrhizobium sp. NAS96.2]
MMEGRKARRLRRSPSSGLSGEVHDETLAARLRRVAEEQAQKAVKDLEEKERERRDPARVHPKR